MITSAVIRRHAKADMAGKSVLFIVSKPANLMGFPVSEQRAARLVRLPHVA
ncbi:MAG: hypothetical protein RIB61_08815 [Roseicyclus sp.]|jgi:hypothetical protein